MRSSTQILGLLDWVVPLAPLLSTLSARSGKLQDLPIPVLLPLGKASASDLSGWAEVKVHGVFERH